MRVRKVVTRSGVNNRWKFPSKKIANLVYCESPLERHAALMFEMHPLVLSYQEQPFKEIYYDQAGKAHECVPDFLLKLVGGGELIVEVKRDVDLARPSIRRKLAQIALRFSELGRPYRVISEKEINREPLRQNLERLWKSVRSIRVDRDMQGAIDALSSQKTFTVGELATLLGGERWVHALIAKGSLRTDLESEMTPNSSVWTAKNQEAGDGAFPI